MCGESGLNEFARICIQNITRDGLAEPVLAIIDETQSAGSTLVEKLRKAVRLDGNLWHLQSRLFPPNDIPSYRAVALDDCAPAIDRIACRPAKKGKWSYYFSTEDQEAIRQRDLDFILKFTPFIIRGEVLKTARYGVWSFHHDDEEKYRGGPPAFWEIVKGDPVTGALLQRLTDRLDGGVVLKHCYVPTDGRSYRKNLQRIQECSAHMVRWVCLDLAAGQAEYVDAPPSKTGAPIYHAPNDFQMLKFWWRLACNWVGYKLSNQRIDEWNAGFVNAPQSAFLDPDFVPQFEWTRYREPNQMVADPFLMPAGNTHRILVEEFNWATEKGRISEIRRSNGASGDFTLVTPVIDEGIHMSYPYAFQHEGVTYAIPETGVTRNILLYRLDEQTGRWTRQATLLDNIDAVDATVFEKDGDWWLMHSGSEGLAQWSLYLWRAPSLLGPWQPHPANPVKTDVSSSRPGGNLFWHEGKLYRPAQDGRLSYGGALAINRVDDLTLQRFSETVVRRVMPDAGGPYPDGLHTLSGAGQVCVVDAKKHRWPIGFLAGRFLAKRSGKARPGFRYSKVSPAPPAPIE